MRGIINWFWYAMRGIINWFWFGTARGPLEPLGWLAPALRAVASSCVIVAAAAIGVGALQRLVGPHPQMGPVVGDAAYVALVCAGIARVLAACFRRRPVLVDGRPPL